jgi:formylglycine-generating enzyme required for sulfatase activity
MLIAFSTSPGSKADDGEDNNSPYTAALSDNLLLRPARLEDVFIKTRIETLRSTNGTQTPWEHSSLQTIFYITKDTNVTITNSPLLYPSLIPKNLLLDFSFTVPFLNQYGMRSKTLNGTAKYYVERASNLEMVEIAGGQFAMGSSARQVEEAFNDARRYNDEVTKDAITREMPQHNVTVPGFYMSKHEITQAQWYAVMGTLPQGIPENMRGADLPIINVTWKDAASFCERLSQSTGRTYRLPSEAEWEYAARAGTSTQFAVGETINSDLVNYWGTTPYGNASKGTYRQTIMPVSFSKTANAFGLYDMHGNVWEWCLDNWHDDYTGAPTNGDAWIETQGDNRLYRIARGGSWDSIANNCRTAHRRAWGVTYDSTKIGFRVVASGE